MKIASILALLCLLAAPALASDVKVDGSTDTGVTVDRVECDTAGCDFYAAGSGWEGDCNEEYALLGPLATGGTCEILSVVVQLDITHTWFGDLNIRISYDADGDGAMDAGPVQLMCRAGLGPLNDPPCTFDNCCGCSGNIAGIFTFGDDAAQPLSVLENVDCFDPDPGCYLPAEGGLPLAAFAGLPAGGDFYLEIGDAACGDPTDLVDWGVYVCCGTTPVDDSTWSEIKNKY